MSDILEMNPERLPDPEKKTKKLNIIVMLFLYTVFFLVIGAGVYYLFITDERTLVRFTASNKDAFSQRYAFIFEFQRFIQNLFTDGKINTWDWSIGLGADGYSFNLANLVNPLNYLTLIKPEKYADITFSLNIILRLYLSGVTFIFFARRLGLDSLQVMAGAIMYAFSPWNIIASVTQGTFTLASVLLPLVLLGAENILQKRSPLLFILSVAYTVVSSFMFAYMIALITLMYYFVRYFTSEHTEKRPLAFIGTTFWFILSGIAGIAVSGFGLTVTLLKFGNSTASTGNEVPKLFSMTEYLRIPLRLADLNTFFGSNSVIGVSALGIILIPVILILLYKRRTSAVMTALLFVLLLIPAVDSFFNFFSYASGRWFFALSLFYSLACAECLDAKYLGSRKVRISIIATFVLYSGYLLWISKILNKTGTNVVRANWITCVVLIIILELGCLIRSKRLNLGMIEDEAEKLKKALTSDAMMKVTCAVMVLVMSVGIAAVYNMRFERSHRRFLKAGKAYAKMSKSSQRIGQDIDDNDFYRIDQLGDLLGKWTPHCKVNEALFYGNRSNYVFYSSVDSDWLNYNKYLGNNMGYYKRVAPNSNDNRFGMDLLMGTKYFIGNDENGIDCGSDYAGHSFEKYQEIEGIELLKNKYSIGLGSVFNKYIYEEEWLKLSYPEREIAMLEAVVLDNGQTPPIGMKKMKAEDFAGIVKKLEYNSDEIDGMISLSAENDDEHQVILSMQNVRASSGGGFSMKVDNGKLKKTVVNTFGDNRGFSDIKDLTVNLGYGRDAALGVNVELKKAAGSPKNTTFDYDELALYQVPLEEYNRRAEELQKKSIKTGAFDNDYFRGTVECEKPGILYLSVPDDDGWEIRVDGKKVKKRNNVDIAFTGVDLTQGRHTVELEYHTRGLVLGIAITVLGLIMTIIMLMWRAKRKYYEEDEEE